MLTETTGRTPQDLADELRDELAVDWPQAWRGLPEPGTEEFEKLCERYGWGIEPPIHDRGSLDVRSRTGADLTIGFGTLWGHVRSVGHYAWHVKAGDPSENGDLLARAAQDWPAYLNAVESVLGAPAWTGPWNAEDFPEPPHPAYWADRASRLESRRPYAFAYWTPAADAPEQPHVMLSQSVTFPTWTTTAPGASHLRLDLCAPVAFLKARE